MASFIDVTALQQFSSFFVFLFVWLAVYAILQATKMLGGNQGISVIIGLVIALLVLFSPLATGVIEFISPWFAVIFIFAIFAGIAFKVIGGSDIDLANSHLGTIVAVVIIIVFIVGALAYVRQQVSIPGENETDNDLTSSVSVIFHPTMLGAIFILIIAVFTVALLTARQK